MALTATDLFNDATTREIGGVGPDQINLIVSDLVGVEQMLTAADPQINNISDLHFRFLRQALVALGNFSWAQLSISGFSNGRRHQFVGL